MERTEKLSEKLHNHGQKITRQRKAILEVLAESDRPMTAEEIFLRVRERKENTSLATVYRNLKKLLGAKILVRDGFLDDKAQYRLNQNDHFHNLICLGCHKVVKIAGCPLENYVSTVGEKEGFTVTEHRVELYGYCTSCSKKKYNERD